MPPSLLQVRGILGLHWQTWKMFRAETWLVEALCSGYCILFHHQQPVLQEPFRVPFLQLRVCESSGTSRQRGQDAGEKTPGGGQQTLLQDARAGCYYCKKRQEDAG